MAQCLRLNDATAVVNRVPAVAASSDYCCAFWARWDALAVEPDFINIFTQINVDYSAYIGFFADDDLYFSAHNGSSSVNTSTFTVAPGRWVHIGYRRTGTSHRWYIFGNLIDTETLDVSGITLTEDIFGFDGFSEVPGIEIKDFAEWNDDKSVNTILRHMRTPGEVHADDTGNLVTYCPFNGDLNDDSGSGNHFSGAGNYTFVTVEDLQENIGPQLATDLSFLPAEQSFNFDIEVPNAPSYFKFTNSGDEPVVISMEHKGDNFGAWVRGWVTEDLSNSLIQDSFEDASFTIPIPVGMSMWFQVFVSPAPSEVLPAGVITFRTVLGPDGAFAAGDLFIRSASFSAGADLDEWDQEGGYTGLHAAFIRPSSEAIIGYVPLFPAGETGDISVVSGRMQFADEGGSYDGFTTVGVDFAYWFYLYEPDFSSIHSRAAFPSPVLPPINRMHLQSDTFYMLGRFSGAVSKYATVSAVSGEMSSVVQLPALGGIVTALAVNATASKMYLAVGGAIKQVDIAGNTLDSDLAATVSGYSVTDILVLADGSIIAIYFNSAGAGDVFIRRYDESGPILNTYTFTFSSGLTNIAPRLGYSTTREDAFLVFNHLDTAYSDLRKVTTAGEELYAIEIPDVNQSLEEQAEAPIPYHSDSCPIIEIMISSAEGNPDIEDPSVELINGEIEVTADITSICIQINRRLGDLTNRIWSADEIDQYIFQAVKEMCTDTHLIWDWVYLENLPPGFSYTAAFEKEWIDNGYEGMNWKYGSGDGMGDGQANYTHRDERRVYPDAPVGAEPKTAEDQREGFGNHTFPDEIPFMVDLMREETIPATANLPHRLTEMERATWDKRTITATDHRFMASDDTRYEIERGEVYAYTWRKDGPRTFRKIRVPSAQADVHEINGVWGLARNLDEVTGVEAEGTVGIPRIVPHYHPIGPFFTYRMWGTPRRLYKDGKNVRVEHWRIPFISCLDSELPPRYRHYLTYYVMWRCLSRQGPGQDKKLAKWYRGRWTEALTRIRRRIDRQVTVNRTGRLGGPGDTNVTGGPPRPRLPWQFGGRTR